MKCRMSKLKLLILNLFVIFTFVILLCLGSWQLDRKAQKAELLDQIKRTSYETILLDNMEITAENLNDWLYRKVSIEGSYMNGLEARVFANLSNPRGEFGGAGYWILTPFLVKDNDVLIVNRGFVPQPNNSNYLKYNDITNNVSIEGYIKRFEKNNIFTPEADFTEKITYLFNKEDLSKIFGIEIKTIFYIDLIDTSISLPQSNETKLTFSDNHLSYAITWYSLATVLLFIYLYSLIISRREIR
tara:strand:+ start:6305 stop:7036 length:732 start_codon:yes stop_codon:yes gene_type:complete